MDKKYKLIITGTESTSENTLFRIVALKDFADVKAGDLGGWIQSENNLSQHGNCWVYHNSRVYGNAYVAGDAKIMGYASIGGSVYISGNTICTENFIYPKNNSYDNNHNAYVVMDSGVWTNRPTTISHKKYIISTTLKFVELV
jgi:hypothetical protein